MPGAPMSARKPTAYSDRASLPQSPMVGLTNAWFAYAAAVSNFAPRTTMPLSVSRTTRSRTSGSCSRGCLPRSPLGSVLAETWNGSISAARRTWLRMFAEKVGSISSSTSWPSCNDHISPTVSSPTRVTTPPMSSKTVSTAGAWPASRPWTVGGLAPIAQVSPVSSSTVGHGRRGGRLVGQVEDPRAHVDDRLERRVAGHVLDLLAVDPDLAAVGQRLPVLLAGPDHGASFTLLVPGAVRRPGPHGAG